MRVSVVIPARNAGDTIADTVASLQAQTEPCWEAIVVSNGSTDDTVEIARGIAAREARVRVIVAPVAGVSAARNLGVAEAAGEYLLFLDADDLLAERALERLLEALAAGPEVEAVHCGWARLTPNGSLDRGPVATETGDLFGLFARYCAFPTHACLVPRALVTAVGGFDPTLVTCEDWDLWQRVARTGVRFAAVEDVLSLYRMRPNSASFQPRRFLADGLVVLSRTHGPDARVPVELDRYPQGAETAGLVAQCLYLTAWIAGLAIGAGQDARPLLELVDGVRDPELDPATVVHCLFETVPLPTCSAAADWPGLWRLREVELDEFAVALEEHSLAPGLARRVRRAFEDRLLDLDGRERPLTIGSTAVVRIEATAPIVDIRCPSTAERVVCELELEGEPFGRIELPVCDGVVPGPVVADAVAADHAWTLLGRLFERTVYPEVASGHAHDEVGWTTLLQEVWGRPGWAGDAFYDAAISDDAGDAIETAQRWQTVEVSSELPELRLTGDASEVDLAITVGGAALGVVTVAAEDGVVKAPAVRAAVTTALGYELARAVVRAGVLGRSLTDGTPLRARLAEAAASARSNGAAPATGVVLGRRRPLEIGGAASRYAVLPAGAADELLRAALAAREPVAGTSAGDVGPSRIVYSPALLGPTAGVPRRSGGVPVHDAAEPEPFGRDHFERLFTAERDPWQYTSAYEQRKYAQTLELIPERLGTTALELACAEGHFTTFLAGRVSKLVASDISEVALARARARCSGLDNVEFVQLDLIRDPLPGRFDLVVCSEVLYYMHDEERLEAVARKIAAALEPGGLVVTAHANLVVDDPDAPGFDWDTPFGAKRIGEVLARRLDLVEEHRTPLYRIQLYRRRPRLQLGMARHEPAVKELPLVELPSTDVLSTLRWYGASSPSGAAGSRTVALPILMYHRVASDGAAELGRYRVTPEAFEEQLRLLAKSGFRGITLAEWGRALRARRAIDGRVVSITFDDGYRDFLTTAWPLLRRYRFPATVFLVTEAVGGAAAWDRSYGEEQPLLSWDEIRTLRDQGVVFGSHTATHPHLASLSAVDVVRELARSRETLTRELGVEPEAVAYPYGGVDAPVKHLAGGCGFEYGLTCVERRSLLHDDPLLLPRIGVAASLDLEGFQRALS